MRTLTIIAILSVLSIAMTTHQQLRAIDKMILGNKSRKLGNKQVIHIEKIESFNLGSTFTKVKDESAQNVEHNNDFPVQIYESLRVTSKMKSYPNIIHSNDDCIYSLTGQLLVKIPNNSVISSLRNQHFYILNHQSNRSIIIQNLLLKNKTLQFEKTFKIQNVSSVANSFLIIGALRVKPSFLVAYSNGSIIKYSDKGQFRNQSDFTSVSIIKLKKGTSNIFAVTITNQLFILDAFKPLETPNCVFPFSSLIGNFFQRSDNLFVHTKQDYLFTISISKCQIVGYHKVPPNSSINQLGEYILVTKQTIAYYINPNNDYSMHTINIKLKQESRVSTAKRSQASTFIMIQSSDSRDIAIYQYLGQNDESFQMKGFKIPFFLLVIGLVVFYKFKGAAQKQGIQTKAQADEEVQNQISNKIDIKNLSKMNPEDLKKALQKISKFQKNE